MKVQRKEMKENCKLRKENIKLFSMHLNMKKKIMSINYKS